MFSASDFIRAALLVAIAVAAASLLSACGGGEEPIDPTPCFIKADGSKVCGIGEFVPAPGVVIPKVKPGSQL